MKKMNKKQKDAVKLVVFVILFITIIVATIGLFMYLPTI